MVTDNHWLKGVKTYTFPHSLILISANHAFSNFGQANIFLLFLKLVKAKSSYQQGKLHQQGDIHLFSCSSVQILKDFSPIIL